jgi:hypothetical protein
MAQPGWAGSSGLGTRLEKNVDTGSRSGSGLPASAVRLAKVRATKATGGLYVAGGGIDLTS